MTVTADPVPIEVGRLFALIVDVSRSDGEAVNPASYALSVTAAMPHHEHGMNTQTVVTPSERGYHVDGMLLHMPGRWEVYLDLTDRGLTRRAVLEIDVR